MLPEVPRPGALPAATPSGWKLDFAWRRHGKIELTMHQLYVLAPEWHVSDWSDMHKIPMGFDGSDPLQNYYSGVEMCF